MGSRSGRLSRGRRWRPPSGRPGASSAGRGCRPIILIGIGRLAGETLETNQYLLREISEEPAALNAALGDLTGEETALVSFNGKSFDVPYIGERAAYYGLNSVLAIYLTIAIASGGLGFSEESVGFLQGVIYALTYVIPILGGALADRYGYRKVLLVALTLLSIGYLISGQMTTYAAVFWGWR
jgi:hypothetical protein